MNKLKKLIWLILLFALGVPAWATTTLRLHLASAGTTGYQGMSLAQGPFGGTAINSVTYTTASGTSIQFTDAVHTNNLAWMSEPFASGVTLSGTETCNIWAKEASAANNASFECQLFKYSGGSLGSAFCTAIYTTELSTSVAAHAPTCSATSTTFSTGDQLVMIAYVINCATSGCPTGTMGAGSPGVTAEYDGPTASSAGDSYVSLAETVTFTPVGGSGGTPSCSLVTDQTEPFNGGFTAAGYTQFYLPQVAGTNNAIIVFQTASPGDTITVADDQSDTFYAGPLEDDTTNGQTVQFLYATGVNGSARELQVHHSATDAWTTGWAMVCTNVATANALDASTGNFASSNSVTAGSVTPNNSGDLWVHAFWNDYTTGAIGSITAGSQTNITWALAQADRAQAIGGQWGVYSSTSASNPTMSTTGTAGFNSIAMALKSSSAGTAFPSTGIQVNAMKTLWIGTGSGGGLATLPRTEQFPCASSNNSMVIEWLGGSSGVLSGLTDSNSNTWTATGSTACNAGGGCSRAFYAQNATVSPTQNITISGTVDADSAKVYCISGGKTSGFFDKTANANGTQSSAGALTAITGFSPSTSNGLVFGTLSVASNTQTGTSSPSGTLFTGCLWSQQTAGNGGCDQNNGWGFYLNPNTTSETWTWTAWTAIAAEGWEAQVDAFEAPSTSQTTPHLFVIVP